MDQKIFHLRFHHRGEFQETTYVGGVETLVEGIDSDIFSYTVLMEHVKEDLHYSAVGGIYVKSGKERGIWKMVTNDVELNAVLARVNFGDHLDLYVDTVIDYKIEPLKQMQPHVEIRPRQNIYAGIKYIDYIKYGVCICHVTLALLNFIINKM